MISSAVLLCFVVSNVFALFEECNHRIQMQRGEKLYINSPYFPGQYPVGTSCRYEVRVPDDYGLKFKCDIQLNSPPFSASCLNEVFYFNREGSELSTESEYFCGKRFIERTSFLNQAVFSYISTPPSERNLLNIVKELAKGIETTTEMATRKTGTTTSTTSTTTTTTEQPLKAEQELTTAKTTSTTSGEIEAEVNSHIKTLSMMTSLTPSLTVDKNVSNSFAYVIALLSNNKLSFDAFETETGTSGETTAESADSVVSIPELFAIETLRPTSVFNFADFLPPSLYRMDPNDIHKISLKREPKVIVGQDYTIPVTQQVTRLGEGGGSFTCLVEVTEPTCECGWGPNLKIAGASGEAGINEFPSMAGVVSTVTQRIFCGAAIIHRRYLLSAGHCFIASNSNRPEYLRVVVGEHDLSTVLESIYTRYYDISKIIMHEFFRSTATTLYNDIALLKTRTPIEWNGSVGPACLPFLPIRGFGARRKAPRSGQRVDAAGWGTTSFGGEQSSVLLKTTLDVISRKQCQSIIRYVPSGAFCTYTPGRDTCQYDSGGALYLRGNRVYAVGIVSYGYACATNNPSVNTRVASHLKWIRSKTPEVKYCVK